MDVRWGEVTGALLTLLIMVALPLVAINYLPAQILEQLSATGLDVRSLAMQTAMLGLVVSAIALAKAVVATTSITYLILDVSVNVFTLAFALLIVGVGNIGSLGLSSFSLKQGKVATDIAIDLRIFIYLTIGAVTLSVLQSIVRFREARAEVKRAPAPN
jgi:hypothetical protein